MIGFFKTSKKYKNNDGINVRQILRQENKKTLRKDKEGMNDGSNVGQTLTQENFKF